MYFKILTDILADTFCKHIPMHTLFNWALKIFNCEKGKKIVIKTYHIVEVLSVRVQKHSLDVLSEKKDKLKKYYIMMSVSLGSYNPTYQYIANTASRVIPILGLSVWSFCVRLIWCNCGPNCSIKKVYAYIWTICTRI